MVERLILIASLSVGLALASCNMGPGPEEAVPNELDDGVTLVSEEENQITDDANKRLHFYDTGRVKLDGRILADKKVYVVNRLCHANPKDPDGDPCMFGIGPRQKRTTRTNKYGYYKTAQGTDLGCYVYDTERYFYKNGKKYKKTTWYGQDPSQKGNKRVNLYFSSCTPSCGNANCGYAPDGCGGKKYCGRCSSNFKCFRNRCRIIL